MESISSGKKQKAIALLIQIQNAISDLKECNKSVESKEDYFTSSEGSKQLLASCILMEAIGDGFKRIDMLTHSSLLSERDDISWKDVVGVRDYIAHDEAIDGAIVFHAVKKDLNNLAEATEYFLKRLAESKK